MKKAVHRLGFIVLLVFCSLSPIFAQQKIDEESTRLIRAYTTEARFLNPLIDHLPQSARVPSPRDVLGYVVGAPQKLTYYADIIRYLKKLDEASENVKLIPIGETTLGRMMYVAVVASAEAIKNLETYKAYTAALADPRKIPEGKAKEIIAKAKPIYYISCNLHSAETGSAEMSMELAYRLAVSEDPFIKTIRDNVIALIIPSLEPDGHDAYTDWYYRYKKNISDERSRFPEAPYWGKYVFHDNNRDIEVSQPLTKNAIKLLLEWHPQLHLDLHEPWAYLFISPGTGPFNPSHDPILIDEWHWLTFWEVTELTKLGMAGVWTHGFSASWYAGYLFEMSNLHNVIGRFYETFDSYGANTMERSIKLAEERHRLAYLSKEWYRPFPPDEKVLWSLRNNINYQESGVLCGLNLVAKNKETILYNFWKKGNNAVAKGRNEPPYAWVIPPGQRHLGEMADVLNLLRLQGVEIHQTEKDIQMKEGPFPKGSYLIRMDQPLRAYAKTMLDVQYFPKSSPPDYDDSGWTLGLMHGVETVRIDDRSILDVPAQLLKDKVSVEGRLTGKAAGSAYVIPHRADNHLITLRFRLKDQEFYAAEEGFIADRREFPPGSFIIPAKGDREKQGEEISSAAKELGLDVWAIDEKISVKKHPLNLPRIALYHTWTSTQNTGWVHFAFDQYKIPCSMISHDRLRQGDLKKDFDVVLIPHQSASSAAKDIVFGIDPRLGPIPYDRTEEFKTMGLVDQSKDITGGMGYRGLENLKEFVDKGGVLILLGSSSRLAMDFGLVRDISEVRPKALLIPGSIVKSEIVDGRSPLVYGYENNVPVYFSFDPLFEVQEEAKKYVVLQYARDENLCLSGLARGEEEIKGRAAVVDVPVFKGHVIMFSFNPLHRFQNKVDFMLVFNILLNFDDLKGGPND